ncbi:hypothetical protein ACGFIK_24230 [Micromonospora sp. NPDC048871]|uniref:hypothetical protein n=1 Tax=unclassified Micromonospora TaxID=2617518 RepID=UPI002E115662|nr:hypothetical protein OIE53_07245 [Micromonospora sp. NBC_01739]
MGPILGRLLAGAGITDKAHSVLEMSLAAAQKIGLAEYAQAIGELLANLPEQGETT